MLSLEDLLAKLFIARTDVKAYQAGPGKYQGQYFTDIVGDRKAVSPQYAPWNRTAIRQHLAREKTYGHYLLNQDNQVKLFAFDIDFQQIGKLPHIPIPTDESGMNDWETSFCETAPRESWADRKHPARNYMKFAMRSLAHTLEERVKETTGTPTAVAYTGSKGLHVYGFTGLAPARAAREAAMMVIDSLPIRASRGKMVFEWEDVDIDGVAHHEEHELFTIEVFPKQDQINNEDGFGNLMRLPLGRNQKSNDPTFFVNTETALGTLEPKDPQDTLQRILEAL